MGVKRSPRKRGSFLSWKILGGFLEEEALKGKDGNRFWLCRSDEGKRTRLIELWGYKKKKPSSRHSCKGPHRSSRPVPIVHPPYVHCWLPNLYTES